MKSRVIIGITLTLSLVLTLFSAIQVQSQPRPKIKVGLIGPSGLPHWSPGMKEAADMAVEEINVAGVNVSGTLYDIELKYGNEYAVPVPDPGAAAAEVERLITVEGSKFIIGGFRTEVTTAMIEKAMDYQTPFLIDGASTNELIYNTVTVNYARYKYLFRVTPVNSTILFRTIGAFLSYIIPSKLLGPYGVEGLVAGRKQVKVAVLTEDLAWTAGMHTMLTDPTRYPGVMGIYANVTYAARIPETATDLSPWLTGVKNSEARLMVHVFSGRPGIPLITQWKDMGIKALPVGINVLGQLGDHWTNTLGKCEYEAILNFAGTATPLTPEAVTFWTKFVARTGKWPIYTAWGAYDGIYGLKDVLEKAGADALNYLTGAQPADVLIDDFETLQRNALNGKFKYAGPNGQHHDVYSEEFSYTWTRNYTRALMVQWQAARMEVTSPIDKTYSRKYKLLPWTYPSGKETLAETDFAPADEIVDISDLSAVTTAWLTKPGDSLWNFNADMDANVFINIRDVSKVAMDWLKTVDYPL